MTAVTFYEPSWAALWCSYAVFSFSANDAKDNKVAHLTAVVYSDKTPNLKIGALFADMSSQKRAGFSFKPLAKQNSKPVTFSYHDTIRQNMSNEAGAKLKKLFQHVKKVKKIAENHGLDFRNVQFLEQYNWAPLVSDHGELARFNDWSDATYYLEGTSKKYLLSENLSLPVDLRGAFLKLQN